MRIAQGWNHREAAGALGLLRCQVTKIESGDRGVSLIEVPGFCAGFKLTEPEFMEEWLKERRREARLMEEFERRRLRF